VQLPEIVPAQPSAVGASGQPVSGSTKAKAHAEPSPPWPRYAAQNMPRVEPSDHDLKKYHAIFETGMEMERRKQARMQQMREDLFNREMEECHFQPHFASGTVGRSYPTINNWKEVRSLSKLPSLNREMVTSESLPAMRKTTGPFTRVQKVQINKIQKPRQVGTDRTAELRRHAINMGVPNQLTSEYQASTTAVPTEARDPKWSVVKKNEIRARENNRFNDALSGICGLVPEPQFVARDPEQQTVLPGPQSHGGKPGQ